MNRVISKDGTPIAYETLGTGEPVILVDGALCSRAMGPMPKVALLLARDFRVICYDRRGRNESGDTPPYAVAREVEDIAALIEAAGGSAMLFGISSGAALVAAAAAGGLAVTKMALYEPPFAAGKKNTPSPVTAGKQITTMMAAGHRGDAVRYFLKDLVGVPGLVVAIMRLTPFWPKLKAIAHTLPYDMAIMNDFSTRVTQAGSIRIPTLVAGGQKSPAWMQHALKQLADTIPNSELVMLKNQTHDVSARAIAPVLADFYRLPTGRRLATGK